MPKVPPVDHEESSLEANYLVVTARCRIPLSEVDVRTETSGGPGGQHANRSRTAVTLTWSIRHAAELSAVHRARLLEHYGPTLRTSASRYRSQRQNLLAAREQLVERVRAGIHVDPPRRASKPTKASQRRRVEQKRARSQLKNLRRSLGD